MLHLIFLGDGINAIRVKNGSIADGRKITVSYFSSNKNDLIFLFH
jgi:hypothetical protein